MAHSREKTAHIQPYHLALVRTPAFPVNAVLSETFVLLKEMISDASPDFYHQIDSIGHDQFYEVDDKKRFALWKYFNRSKYRPVPFARFASVALVPVGLQSSKQSLTLQKKMQVSAFAGWESKDSWLPTGRQLLKQSDFLVTNTTIYRLENSYRYLYQKDGISYLGEVDIFNELEFILNFCHLPQNKQAIIHHLHDQYGLCAIRAKSLLINLLNHQLLYTEKMPNLTGQDYFTRIGMCPEPDQPFPYLIAKRRPLSGKATLPDLVQLQEVVDWLNRHLPVQEYRSLDTFKNSFTQRFDRRSISLAEALDPELGVGYAGLAAPGASSSYPILDQIFSEESGSPLSPHLNALLMFIVSRSSGRSVVRLEDFQEKSQEPLVKIPNTLSVVGYPHSGYYVIEHLGGCTANALLGRFTLNNPEITTMCRSLAVTEENANPGVSFFDVSYPAEKNVDNINRRERIFSQELPLLCWSTHPCPLKLSDIYVRIEGSEIILFSVKSGQRLVPRIATAYNYTRSDLALYRFLSDLQHQGLRTDLTLALRQRCPGLDHYPRICYKDLILSPETWLLPQAIHQAIIDYPAGVCQAFLTWLRSLNCPNSLLKSGNGDQTLVFCLTNNDDLAAFTAFCRRQPGSSIYVEEVLTEAKSGVVDENGDGYTAQQVLSYYHQQQIYKPIQPLAKLAPSVAHLTRQLLPGSDWLYLEIYCHPARANEIVIQHLQPLFHLKRQRIKKWFFVRYHTGGAHLRIRIHLKDTAHSSDMLTSVQQVILPLTNQGLVTDMQIKTYQRELERYGYDLMEQIEQCFCQDTQVVIRQLKRNQQPELLYRDTLAQIRALVSVIFPQADRQISFARMMADQFSKEFDLDTAAFKIINVKYREIKMQPIADAAPIRFLRSYQYVLRVLQSVDEVNRQKALLADILHMHLNRLFAQDQRKHEAVVYQLLLKDILRHQHMTTSGWE